MTPGAFTYVFWLCLGLILRLLVSLHEAKQREREARVSKRSQFTVVQSLMH